MGTSTISIFGSFGWQTRTPKMVLDLCGYCRLPHMVTHPGTQAYHVNKLGTELALTALHGDMSLTKLIPRFQYPKFLPQFQVVASICSADAGGWMPGCETACTQLAQSTLFALQGGKNTACMSCLHERFNKRAQKTFDTSHSNKTEVPLPNSLQQALC